MRNQKQAMQGYAIVAAILMVIAFVMREIYEGLPNAMLQSVMCLIRDTIHISLLFSWVVSVQRRLVNRNVRRLMLMVGCLLLFWLIDKIVKWDFTGSVTHPLVRYLWYGFCVGTLFVPTLGNVMAGRCFRATSMELPVGWAEELETDQWLPSCVIVNVVVLDEAPEE